MNPSSRTISLKMGVKAVTEAITRGGSLTFNALHPGMLVNVTIDKKVEVTIFLLSLHLLQIIILSIF